MTDKHHVHILGIAGHAMRGVALALKDRGWEVTGTDENAYPPGSDWLDEHKITWWREPAVAHLDGVSLLVLGGGEPADHLELLAAQKRGIAIKSYPQVVGELVAKARRIVIAGTHGKTTTTSLITWILESAGRKPDYLIGIQPHNFDTSVRLADSDIAVLEGDEYRSSRLDITSKFIYYQADVVVITSIEHDHPDLFGDLAAVRERFTQLVTQLPHDGRLFVCDASAEAVGVAVDSGAPITTYGYDGHWKARNVEYLPDGLSYDLVRHDEPQGRVHLPLYGEHNILNSLAAAGVSMNEGVTFEQLCDAAATFKGAARRFERVSAAAAKVTVIDDYAHHPTEVVATIAAAKRHFKGRVVAIFRPHTYSRTLALMTDYHQAFAGADQAFILPIEGAREGRAAEQTSGEDIAKGAGGNISYQPDRAELIKAVAATTKPGDIVLCMSVSGYNDLAQELATVLG